MSLSGSNQSTPWFLPVTMGSLFAVVASTAAFFGIGNMVDDKGNQVSSQEESDSTGDDDGTEHNLIPTYEDLASFPSMGWEDPFAHRDDARTKLSSSGNLNENRSSSTFRKNLYEFACSIDLSTNKNEGSSLLIMPVVCPGSPNQADTQVRLERRHAVDGALAAEGFSLIRKNRLDYINIHEIEVHQDPSLSSSTMLTNATLPIMEYRNNSNRKRVVVIWVDENWLGERPLYVLTQIVSRMLGMSSVQRTVFDATLRGIDVAILGPGNSDNLKKFFSDGARSSKLHSNLDHWLVWSHLALNPDFNPHAWYAVRFWSRLRSATLFSFAATVNPIKFKETNERNPRHIIESEDESVAPCIRIIHTIGTNKQLRDALCDELRLRGIMPDKADLEKHRVLIFTEQQSASPRVLQRLFFQSGGGDDVSQTESVVIPYMRGIYRGNGSLGEGSTDPDFVRDYFARKMHELGHGRSELSALMTQVRLIGVMANRPEDALAILKSARDVFPNARFFTFDMSSRFEDPVNQDITRGLIVASHYSLELHGSFPKNSIRFRTGYQTSLYLAASIACRAFTDGGLGEDHFPTPKDSESIPSQDYFDLWGRFQDEDSKAAGVLEPVVIEIGRDGAHVQPRVEPRGEFAIRQPTTRRSFLRPQSMLAGLGILAVLFGVVFVGRAFSDRLRDNYQRWCVDAIGDLCRRVVGLGRSAAYAARRAGNVGTELNEPISPNGDQDQKDTKYDWLIVLIGIVILGYLFVLIGYNEFSASGERFVLLSGASVWPSICLFAIVFFVCTGVILSRVSSQSGHQLDPFEFPEMKSSNANGAKVFIRELFGPDYIANCPSTTRTGSENEKINDLVKGLKAPKMHYQAGGLTILICLFIWLVAIFSSEWDWLRPPGRNTTIRRTALLFQLFAEVAVTGLVSFSVVRSLSLRYVLSMLKKGIVHPFSKPDETESRHPSSDQNLNAPASDNNAQYANDLTDPPPEDPYPNASVPPEESASLEESLHTEECVYHQTESRMHRQLEIFTWIERQTRRTGASLLLPSCMILVFVIARLPIWAPWPTSRLLFAAMIVPFVMAIASSAFLRIFARRLRESFVDTVRFARFTESDKSRAEKMQSLEAAVQEMRNGAFSPLIRDPVLGSCFLIVLALFSGPGQPILNLIGALLGGS